MRRIVALLALVMLVSVPAQYQPEEILDISEHVVREDIATAGDLETAQRIVRFVQVSDAHIIDDDAPFPVRAEPFDNVGYPIDGGYRPHEEYTDEVLNSAIAQINAEHAKDSFDFVINTGDNIDNQLENELMRFIDNWEGTSTTSGPISGKACLEDGPWAEQDDASTDVQESCTSLPAAVAGNNTALAGDLPWYSAFGNHDGLYQGNTPRETGYNELADQYGRYFVDHEEYVDMHFKNGKCTASEPGGDQSDDWGHGYGFAGSRLCDQNPDNDGYYAFSVRDVRFIVLDTLNDDFVNANSNVGGVVNPQDETGNDAVGGYAGGAIDPDQYQWLEAQLGASAGRPVVIFAHHTVNSFFTEQFEGQCMGQQCLDQLFAEAGYVSGPQLTERLAQQDNLLAFVGGHTHQHRIEAKITDDGGFWNIETSSLVDLPQESRIIEVWAAADGKWFLKTDQLGHDYEPSKNLAATDPQQNPNQIGADIDRSVILWTDLAADVAAEPQPYLPYAITLRPTSGVGTVGAPFQFEITATDAIRAAPVDGLNLTLSIGRVSGSSFVQIANGAQMSPNGNGTYVYEFVPAEASTHFATIRAVDPEGTYPTNSQTFSVIVDGVETVAKKTPGPSLVIVGIALAMLARRR